MRRILVTHAVLTAVVLTVLVALLGGPDDRVELRPLIVVLGGVATLIPVAALRETVTVDDLGASRLLGGRRPGTEERMHPGPARWLGLLSSGTDSARAAAHRTRPALAELARRRLADRRSVNLDTDPQAGRLHLGDEAWNIVAPALGPPDPRLGAISPADVDRLLTALEAL